MDRKPGFWALWGLVFFLFLNYPFLQMANQEVLVAGTPLLVLYLFGMWLGAILVLYLLARRLLS